MLKTEITYLFNENTRRLVNLIVSGKLCSLYDIRYSVLNVNCMFRQIQIYAMKDEDCKSI